MRILSLTILISLMLSSCSSSLYHRLSKDDKGNNKYKGHYKIGEEYQIKNETYKPAKNLKYDETGIGSWYGSKNGFHGKKTANGDLYNKNMLTAAHRTLPLPSMVKITNLANNKSLIVMVNDRGPFSKGRIIDVSESAAKLLDFKQKGTAKLRVQYLNKETKELLHTLALKPKHGAKSTKKVKNPQCSVNCHIKLVNMKHNLIK